LRVADHLVANHPCQNQDEESGRQEVENEIAEQQSANSSGKSHRLGFRDNGIRQLGSSKTGARGQHKPAGREKVDESTNRSGFLDKQPQIHAYFRLLEVKKSCH
jgi:hypothetical protein